MEFEYDPSKSKSNFLKHGINFVDAQQLWLDERRLEIQSRNNIEEPRWVIIGCIGELIWAAINTKRTNRIRIISVRRARNEEKELYYGE